MNTQIAALRSRLLARLANQAAGPDPAALLAMKRARVALLTQAGFFGALGLRLTLQEMAEPPGLAEAREKAAAEGRKFAVFDSSPTMACDGTVLRYHPEKVLAARPDDLKALVALHVMRCVAGHPWRRGGRKAELWNRAGELAMTPLLKDAGFTLPEGCLYEDRFRDHSAEAVYRIIEREQPPGMGGGGGDDPEGDESGDSAQGSTAASQIDDAGSSGKDEDQQQEFEGAATAPPQSEADWRMAGLQAEMAAKKRGQLPGAAKRLLEELSRPTLDWRVLLRRFMREQAKSDHDWTRPNRRYMASGLYLPSLRSKGMGEVVVFVDSSGSTWNVLEKFGAELTGISQDLEPASLHVAYWDTELQAQQCFAPGEPIVLEPHGGGGTDFTGCFTWLEEQVEAGLMNPCCVVFLTDLEAYYPEAGPSVPLLWAAVGNKADGYWGGLASALGDVVEIEEE